jgi:hypothetical protein
MRDLDSGVSDLIEYFLISGMLMLLIIITVLSMTPVVIYQPTDQLSEYAFIDIGNGVSTRIVDLYVIRPDFGTINTSFDIPDDVVGREYEVVIESGSEQEYSGDYISVSYSNIRREVPLAGIGQSVGVEGSTTGHGLNEILYNSSGWVGS